MKERKVRGSVSRWLARLAIPCAVALAAACDDGDPDGACYAECPSDAWGETEVPDGGGWSQTGTCHVGQIHSQEECVEWIAEDREGSVENCQIEFVPDCDDCQECAPGWIDMSEPDFP